MIDRKNDLCMFEWEIKQDNFLKKFEFEILG